MINIIHDRDRALRMADLSFNMLVPYYLMASYLYYELDVSLFPDEEYDKVCLHLDLFWDGIEHQHKHLIDRGALSATTGYTIKDYPLRVMHGAQLLAKQRGLL
jgi:NAD-dependent DNA ligase